MDTNPSGRSRQSWSIAMTPLSAARAAFALGKALDQAGWHVIPTSDAASFTDSALACIVILSPQNISDSQVVAALSAKFSVLIPVVTAPMTLPDAPWSCEAFPLSAMEAQQAETGAAISAALTRLLPAASRPSQAASIQPPIQPPVQPYAAGYQPAASQQPPVSPSPAPVASWTPAPPVGEGGYGALIEEFSAGAKGYVVLALGVIALLIGLTGAFGGDATTRWFLGLIGVVAIGIYYFMYRGAHARLFERGFTVTVGGKSTRARWEEIANVEHWQTTTRLYGLIPTGKSYWYKVVLKSGERVSIQNTYRNYTRLGEQIEIKWRETLRRAG